MRLGATQTSRGASMVALAMILLSTSQAWAWDGDGREQRLWSTQSANTIEDGRLTFGIFEPLRYGLSEDIELFAHPLVFFLMPHLGSKIVWSEQGQWLIGTRHQASYTGLLFSVLSREGTGGVLPADTDAGHGIVLDNDVLMSLPVFERHTLTLSTGITLATTFGGQENRPLVDMPLLYNRFAALNSGLSVRAGLAWEGWISDDFSYGFDVRLDILPAVEGGYTLEQGLRVSWHISEGFTLKAGTIGTTGHYPAGSLETMLLPYLDLVFGF